MHHNKEKKIMKQINQDTMTVQDIINVTQKALQDEVNAFYRDEDNQIDIEANVESRNHRKDRSSKARDERSFNNAMAKQLIS